MHLATRRPARVVKMMFRVGKDAVGVRTFNLAAYARQGCGGVRTINRAAVNEVFGTIIYII